jgi:type IV secretion system protein VirB11
MSFAALETFLLPFQNFFKEEGVSEISVNVPGEVWVEKYGDMRLERVPTLTFEHLKSLARLIAQSTEQNIAEETPLLSAALPNGFRVQVVFPPACESSKVVMSIRKVASMSMTLDKYKEIGAFDNTAVKQVENKEDTELLDLIKNRDIKEFLSRSVKYKKNIIISGGTSTGKTTFANAMLLEIPTQERLITCEDAREILLPQHKNSVHLLASKGGQGRAKVTINDLIEACLRLRPDRIIVGELRGAEAFSFLRAINTGHPGSIATLHADTPNMAFEQLKLMVMQAGMGIPPDQVRTYTESVVEVIVQLKRAPEGGRRYISEIYFKGHKPYG